MGPGVEGRGLVVGNNGPDGAGVAVGLGDVDGLAVKGLIVGMSSLPGSGLVELPESVFVRVNTGSVSSVSLIMESSSKMYTDESTTVSHVLAAVIRSLVITISQQIATLEHADILRFLLRVDPTMLESKC